MDHVPPQWVVSILVGFIGGIVDGVQRHTDWAGRWATNSLATIGYGVAGAIAGFLIYTFNAADSGWDVAAKPGTTGLSLITGLAGVDYLRRWRDNAKSQAANSALREATENLTRATEQMEPRRRQRRGG